MLKDPTSGLAVLRVSIGLLFLAHGLDGLTVGLKRTRAFFDEFRVPLPGIATPLTGLSQAAGGAAIVVGFFAPVAAAILVLLMVGAIVFVHGRFGFSNINIVGEHDGKYKFGMPGFEFNYALIAALMAIVIGGPGAWALT